MVGVTGSNPVPPTTFTQAGACRPVSFPGPYSRIRFRACCVRFRACGCAVRDRNCRVSRLFLSIRAPQSFAFRYRCCAVYCGLAVSCRVGGQCAHAKFRCRLCRGRHGAREHPACACHQGKRHARGTTRPGSAGRRSMKDSRTGSARGRDLVRAVGIARVRSASSQVRRMFLEMSGIPRADRLQIRGCREVPSVIDSLHRWRRPDRVSVSVYMWRCPHERRFGVFGGMAVSTAWTAIGDPVSRRGCDRSRTADDAP